MQFDITVEIPRGSRNKYEVDHETGRIRLDRTLFTATRYPADYGFVEDTLGQDGDPLDALVLTEEPVVPGCLITCRPVAMFVMSDENGPDEKVLCVPAGDPRFGHLRDLEDIPPATRAEIGHFFEVYKALEPNKAVEISHWAGREDAEREVEEARQRYSRPQPGTAFGQ
ncbi:inorganic diphosphatase [Streptomyces sp. NPDC047046]|uniref:inorganic diphosphatase n=1 Tax=Streptomyces sp. NPDC047046 TaxID=3155378 RepID=UPI0033C896E0